MSWFSDHCSRCEVKVIDQVVSVPGYTVGSMLQPSVGVVQGEAEYL